MSNRTHGVKTKDARQNSLLSRLREMASLKKPHVQFSFF